MDLNKDGVLTFAPNVNFYADTSPPQSNARFGLMKNNANGDVRVDSSCDDDAIFRHENVMLNGKAAGTEGWTFYSMSRKNTSAISDRVFDTALNLVRWTESGSQVKMNLCLYDPSSMFNLLEVNNDVLLSPIMMIPDYVSPAYVQQVYLKASSAMAERGGPRLPKLCDDFSLDCPSAHFSDSQIGFRHVPLQLLNRVHQSTAQADDQ
jgi:hypothetical protein